MDNSKKDIEITKTKKSTKTKKITIDEALAVPKKKNTNNKKNKKIENTRSIEPIKNKQNSTFTTKKVSRKSPKKTNVNNTKQIIKNDNVTKEQKKILPLEDISNNIVINNTDEQIPIKKSVKKVNKEDTKIKNEEPSKILISQEMTTVPVKLSQKEINRKKYEKAQQRYRANNKTKIIIKEEKEEIKLTDEVIKNEEKKPKKNNKVINIIRKITRKYKENLANENNFYLQVENKKKRFKRYVKEASIYAIIISFLNILAIIIFKNIDTINLFDIKALNAVLTMLFFLIISFLIALLFDFIITEIWIKIKRKKISKKKESEQSGDKGTK